MLQIISVSKNYGPNISALKDISLEIQDGEFVFLVGPSGSGKTTLIRMLIREELPSTGKIFFHDEDITRYNRRQVYSLRRKIGVIFQDYKLIPELNAFENIAFAMEAAGKSDKEIKEYVPYLLDIVGLTNRTNFFPRQLSGGEKQRVAIARAMANNPKLLIADEPTGNLDPDSAWDIVQILSKINNWGTTVLMSTHGSDIVNSLHKRVLRMEDGALVRDDFRGSYDEVDEFSLKVLSESGKQAEAASELVQEATKSAEDSQAEEATPELEQTPTDSQPEESVPPEHTEQTEEPKASLKEERLKGRKTEKPKSDSLTPQKKQKEKSKPKKRKISFSTKKVEEKKDSEDKN